MTFTLEDGTGVAGANAYVTDTFVTAYLKDRDRASENGWQSASLAAKQAAIIGATDYIEKVFGRRFLGRRTVGTQGLSWPRLNVHDVDGFVLASDALPVRLEQATAEYAVRALSFVLLPDPTYDDSGKTVVASRDRIGPIEEERRFAEGGAIANLIRAYPAADNLIKPLLHPAGRLLRG